MKKALCQCGSCESIFYLADNDTERVCPFCHSGNWVYGYIDDVAKFKIKCNMCGKHFESGEDLAFIKEADKKTGKMLVYKGCPYCKTDAYLMDIE